MNAQTRREMGIKLFETLYGRLYSDHRKAERNNLAAIDATLREWGLEMARLCEPDSGAESAITAANDQQKGAG
jgi:hypothetical protein